VLSPGIVPATVRGSRAALRLIAVAACCAPAVSLAAGCGEARRNAGEPRGTFSVEVLSARFSPRQAIAHDSALEIVVRNAGGHTIPNVGVTVDSFSYRSAYPGLAANLRPTWIVNQGPGPIAHPPVESEAVNPPGGGVTVLVNTWALGALAPGGEKTFVWKVTPIKAGRHTLHFQIVAGLDGRARARLAGGKPATGQFSVQVAPAPRATHVSPETGAIAGGPPPTPAGPLPAVP
jgi:hypothetical protein